MPSRSLLILLSVSVAAPVLAHDLYLLPRIFHVKAGQQLRVAFHNGDSFPESEVAPKPPRLQSAQILGHAATVPVSGLKVAGKETLGQVKVPGTGSLLLSVRTIPNSIELAPPKFLDYLKEEGLQEVIEWRSKNGENEKPGRERYTKFAKSLLQSGASDSFYSHSLDFPIEIIPLADPYAIHAGGNLPVRVMFQGKPAAGLQLETAWASGTEHKTIVVGKTGANGEISVPLPKAGLWRLHSLKMERCAEPAVADWESSWASLTFEIR